METSSPLFRIVSNPSRDVKCRPLTMMVTSSCNLLEVGSNTFSLNLVPIWSASFIKSSFKLLFDFVKETLSFRFPTSSCEGPRKFTLIVRISGDFFTSCSEVSFFHIQISK